MFVYLRSLGLALLALAALPVPVMAQLGVTPSALSFGTQVVSTASIPRTVTLTNASGAAQAFTLATTGDYAATSACGTSVAAGATCQVAVTFTPTVLGTRAGTLQIRPSSTGVATTVTLSGSGVTPTTLSPTSLAFGAVVQNTASAARTVRLTNNLDGPLTGITFTSSSPEYTVTGCPATLAPRERCTASVVFTPTAPPITARPATLSIAHSASPSPAVVPLSGTSTFPITFNTASVNFQTTVQGTTSRAVTVTLRNNQLVPLQTFTASVPAPFSATGCTALPLAPGRTCSLTLTYSPGLADPLSVVRTLTTSSADPTVWGAPRLRLTGTARPQMRLSSTRLTFRDTAVGATSAAVRLTITNNRPTTLPPLTLGSPIVTFTGAAAGDFARSGGSCGSTLASLASCTVDLTFTPRQGGPRAATVNVHSNALGAPFSATLTGLGTTPMTVTPTALSFGTSGVGLETAPRLLTLTNNQQIPVTFGAMTPAGDFAVQSTTCGATLPPGATCTVSVTMRPTIGGARTGSLTVASDTSASPNVIGLTGTGNRAVTASPTSLSFPSQKINTASPSRQIVYTNHQSVPVALDEVVTGDFTATTACGGTIPARSSCVASVVFRPTATGSRAGLISVNDPGSTRRLDVRLSGAGTTTDPPAAITNVSPGAGQAGATVTGVVVTGNGYTHFSPASVVSFGAGITVSNMRTVTTNSVAVDLAIAADALPGGRTASVATPLAGGGTETATLAAAFVVSTSPDPSYITIAPVGARQGETVDVVIEGDNTTFAQATIDTPGTTANFGPGIAVNGFVQVQSPTRAIANVTVSPTADVGWRAVTVVTGGQFATLQPVGAGPGFLVSASAASLTSLAPSTGEQGATPFVVTITGTGTHFLQGATTVSLGDGINVGSITVVSPTEVRATVAVTSAAVPGLRTARVVTGGESLALAGAFTVTPSATAPYLTGVQPAQATQGDTVTLTITAANTSFTTQAPTLTLGPGITVSNLTVVNATTVTADLAVAVLAPTGLRQGGLTSGGTQFAFDFTVQPRPVAITRVEPAVGAQGEVMIVRLTGENTHWNQDTTFARFVTPPWCALPTVNRLTVLDPTSAELVFTIPTNSCTQLLGFQVITGGESVAGTFGVYRSTPSLTLGPSTGLVGSTLTVNLIGEFTHFAQGATTVAIDGADVRIQDLVVTGPTSATATFVIEPDALSGPCQPLSQSGCHVVTVTTPRPNGTQEVLTAPFRVVATPATLTGISPDRARPGTTVPVTITGLHTTFAAGVTTVGFGPDVSVSNVTVASPTEVRATIAIAANAATGYRTAFVNTGAEQLTIGFLVESPDSPSLTSVSPSAARQGQSATVTILGRHTTFGAESTLILGAGVTVAEFTVESPTRATAVIQVSPTAALGRNPVTVITPTPSGQEVVTGASFFVEPGVQRVLFTKGASAPDPVAPYPALAAAQGQTLQVALVGEGTHWLQGATRASFGAGVIVNQVTVADATHATAQITVLSTAPLGFRQVVMTTGGESASMAQALNVQQATPALLSTSPLTGAQAATFDVQLLGRFTSWQQGVTTVDYGDDVTVNAVTVIDSVSAVANVTINPLAYTSPLVPCRTVSVTTGQEQVSLVDQLCVSAGIAAITSVSPSNSTQGSTVNVVVTGQATHFAAGVTTADFGPGVNVGNVQVVSPTQANVSLAVSSQAANGYRTVAMRTLGETASLPLGFVVGQSTASLTAANPVSGQQGQQNLVVRLLGQNTAWAQGVTTVNFGASITVDNIAVVDATTLDATIDIAAQAVVGGRMVTVTTGGQIVSGALFTVTSQGAVITRVTPDNGNQGQEMEIVVSSQGTAWASGVTQFSMTGVGKDVTVNYVLVTSPTELRVGVTLAPTAELGGRSVFVTTGTQALVNPSSFVVTGGIPAIASVQPGSAKVGETGVNVEVRGLYTEWLTGSPAIDFGPGVTVLDYTVNSNTSISAVLDIAPAAGLGPRTVVVRNGLQTLTGSFSVVSNAPPTPSLYVTPPSALRGQTVDVAFTGRFTNWDTSSTLQIGDPGPSGIAINSFQVLSPTTAVANLTISGAAPFQSHQVDIVTGTELVQSQFAVVQEQPQLTVVDPSSGMQGTTRTLTVLGQHVQFGAGTTFDFGPGVAVEAIEILGPNAAQVRVAIDLLASLGGRTVTATTDGVSVSRSLAFSVTPSAAEIVSVSPNTARQNARITVAVTGRNTNWNSSTTFGFGSGITVLSRTVSSPTQAAVEIELAPLAMLGSRTVTATTGGEVASLGNVFVVQEGTPLVLSSAPTTGLQQQTVTLAILGQFTQWAQGQTTVAIDGGDVTVTSATVTSPTSITAQVAVGWFAAPGGRTIRVTTAGQALSLPGGFVVAAGPAAITQVVPASAGQGTTLNVTVTGVNTHFTQGTTLASFGAGISVNSVTVTSPTVATVNITVAAGASPGLRSIAMTTQGEVATLANAFTVIFTTPTIQFVTPTSLAQGASSTVTVIGQNTAFTAQTVFSFGGAGVTVGTPTIVSGVEARMTVTVSPTAARTTRDVTATTGPQVATGVQKFTVSAGPARLTSVSPTTVKQNTNGVQVTLFGIDTHFQSSSVVDLGTGVTVTNVQRISATQVVATVNVAPAAPLGLRTARVTTGGEVAELAGVFEVRAGDPVLTAITPTSARQGQTLTVQVSALYTSFTTGAPTLSLGAGITVNGVTVVSDTQLSASITVQPTATVSTRAVSLTSSGQPVNTSGYTFAVTAGQPELLTVSPSTGDQGSTQVITITGQFTNFSSSSVVSFGGSGLTTGAVTVNGPTQLQVPVTVGLGASVGPRTVTVTTGTEVVSLASAFTVIASPPAISVIAPNVGVPNSTVAVTITGRFTSFTGGTTQARFGAGISVNGGTPGDFGPVSVQSATQATATLTIAEAASLGPRDVTVRTGSEVLTELAGFTVQSTSPTAPTVTSITPYNGEDGVPLNTSVTIEFSGPVDRNTVSNANVRLVDYTTQGACWAYSASLPGTVSVSASGRLVTFTPASVLAVGRQHGICINYGQQGSPNGIRDGSGNHLGAWFYSFVTGFGPDASGPTFLGSNIAPDDTSVPTDVPITLAFSRAVNRATIRGALTITDAGAPVPGTFGYTSDYRQVTFTPTAALTANTVYTVSYGSGIEDSVGTSLTNPGSFTFATGAGPDSGGPVLVSRSPRPSGTSGITPVIRVTLDRPIDPLRLTSSNVYLVHSPTGAVLPGTRIEASADRRSVLLTPARALEPGTTYSVYAYVYNRRGNATWLPWSFLTSEGVDTTSGTIGELSPADAATAVPTNARIRFRASEALDRTSGPIVTLQPAASGTLSSSDDRDFVFTPTSPLAPATAYTVTLGGLRDSSGNAMADVSWAFTTGGGTDTAPGTITSIQPGNVAPVPVTSTVVVSLSEPAAPASVTPSSVWIGDQVTGQIVAGTLALSSDRRTITFTPMAPLAAARGYTVWVSYYASLLDDAGNAFSYRSGGFTTAAGAADTTAPAVATITPFDGAEDIGPNHPITITFSEAMRVNTLTAANIAVFAGPDRLSVNVAPSPDGRMVTLTGQLTYGLPHTVLVSPAVTDVAGNRLVQQFASAFLVGDRPVTTRPEVRAFRPGSGAVDVPADRPLVFMLSQPIDPTTVPAALFVAQDGVLVTGALAYSAEDHVVTFRPSVPFRAGARVEAWFTNGATDPSGNALYDYQASFTVRAAQVTTPGYLDSVPAWQESQVPTNTRVDLRFNTPLLPASITGTNVYLTYCDGVVRASSLQLLADARVVRLTPSAPLPANAAACVSWTSQVLDANGRAIPASYTQFYTAAGPDSAAPTLVNAAPADGAVQIGVNARIALTFSERLAPGSLTPQALQLATGATTLPYTVATAANQDGTFTVTLVPADALPASASVTVSGTSALVDRAGNPVAPFTVTFTTMGVPEYAPARIVHASVLGGDKNVPVTSTFRVRYERPIDARTVTPGAVYLYDHILGRTIASTLHLSVDRMEIAVVPQAPLGINRAHTLAVSGVQDLTGNTANSISIQFTTALKAAVAGPVVLATSPYAGMAGVPSNFRPAVRFDRAIDRGSLGGLSLTSNGQAVPFTTSVNPVDNVVTVVPGAPLLAGASYLLTVAGVRDAAGLSMAAPVSVPFTTGAGLDLVTPVLVSATPPDAGTVGTQPVIRWTYSEPIDRVRSAPGYLYNQATGGYVQGVTFAYSADWKTVTLLYPGALDRQSSYTACFTSAVDLALNSASQACESFATGDATWTSPLTIDTVTPADGATGVPINSPIRVRFSRALDATSLTPASFALSPDIAAAVQLSTDRRTVTLTPASAFAAGVTYTLTVSGVHDVDGNVLSTAASTFTTAATADSTRGTITLVNPAPNATGVPVGTSITLALSKPVDPLSVTDLSFNVATGSTRVTGTISVGSDGRSLTLVPAVPLPGGAPISVAASYYESLRDLAGNTFQYVFGNFTTAAVPDVTAPTILAVTPVDGTTDIGPWSTVSLRFSEPIDPGTITATNFALYDGYQNVGASVERTADNRTVTLRRWPLPYGTALTVVVGTGARDLAGNPLAEPFRSTFTTLDPRMVGAPQVTSMRPGHGATNVVASTVITLFTTRPVDEGSLGAGLTVAENGVAVPGTITVDDGYSIVFRPTTPFAAGALVQVFLTSQATDVAGNPFAAWSSQFSSASPPTSTSLQVASYSPAWGQSAPRNAVADIRFNKPVDPATVTSTNVYAWTCAGGAKAGTPTLLSPTVIRLTASAAFEANTCVYVYLQAGLRGTDGSAFAATYLYFATTADVDATPPTVTAVTPPHGSTGVGDNATVRVRFSERMSEETLGTGGVTLTSGGQSLPYTMSFTSTEPTVITLTPQAPLPDGVDVTVGLAGSITDRAGLALAPVSSTFRTGVGPDTSTPQVVRRSVQAGQVVPLNLSTVTWEFSEPLAPDSITPTTVSLYRYSTGTYHYGTPVLSSDGRTLTLPLPIAMTAGVQYQLCVNSFADLAGNTAGNCVIVTAAGATVAVAPTVIGTSPSAGATGTVTNPRIELVFSTVVDQTSLGGLALTADGQTVPVAVEWPSYGGNLAPGQVVRLVPLALLEPNTTYTVSVADVKDSAGNVMATPFGMSFTTGRDAQTSGQTAFQTATVTANGVQTQLTNGLTVTGVSPTTTAVVVFSRPVGMPSLLAGGVHIRLRSTGAVVPSSIGLSADGRTVTLTPLAALAANTQYEVSVNYHLAGVIDVAGYQVSGQAWGMGFQTVP